MTASSFTLNIPAGLEVNQFLSFAPLAAIVSNFTPYYIYFPDGLSFVPPWTNGAIISLSHATQARASWLSSPFGAQTLTTVVGITYTATISFTDDPNLSPSGGTQITPPATIPGSYLRGATASSATTTVTVTFAPAIAGNLLVAGFSYISGGVAGTVAGPAGWTTLQASGSATQGYWQGYKVAVGGETSAVWTVTGITNSALAALVAEYTGFKLSLFQYATAVAATVSVTPVASPNLLIGLSTFTAGGGVIGAVSSSTTTLRASSSMNYTTVRGAGVAIGDLTYNSVGSEPATFLWVGTTPTYQTAAIAAE